jgi:hypothetical protein
LLLALEDGKSEGKGEEEAEVFCIDILGIPVFDRGGVIA